LYDQIFFIAAEHVAAVGITETLHEDVVVFTIPVGQNQIAADDI
jgi:hypothetical protein